MFAPMLFAIAIFALAQFAVYYWRAILSGVAAQPVSARVLDSAGVEGGRLSGGDFPALAELHNLTPNLEPSTGELGVVRAYYEIVRALGLLSGPHFPQMAAWSERERTICARYAAVQIDRRLQANLALAASLRSC
ncbi:MAG TPA: hypothetical protein VKF79_09840 [Candidatus Acidoferrum sp.]|nr:hypothetical protein [Candidatus Acidoferrum sp.]